MKSINHKVVSIVILVITALAILAALVASMRVDASGTVSVSGNTSAGVNQAGWLFGGSAPYSFVHNVASFGIGSLYVGPLVGGDEFSANYFPGTLLVSDFHSFSYDYMIGSGGDNTDSQNFFVSAFANIDNSANDYDCRYDYEAKEGQTDSFRKEVIFEQDAPSAVVKSSSARISDCPPTLEQMPAGSHIRVFTLNAGGEATVGLDAYFDNVVVELIGDFTAFNFEPKPRTKEDCANNGWKLYKFRNNGQCVKSLE